MSVWESGDGYWLTATELDMYDEINQRHEELGIREKGLIAVKSVEYTNEINDLISKYKDTGWSADNISDKWHTFGELYYHRMILFLTIQKAYPKRSWKAKQHHDGTMFEDSFIVGINTDEGQYTYHYDLKYWELFKDIKELDKAPEWDGHMPKDITRLLSLSKKR